MIINSRISNSFVFNGVWYVTISMRHGSAISYRQRRTWVSALTQETIVGGQTVGGESVDSISEINTCIQDSSTHSGRSFQKLTQFFIIALYNIAHYSLLSLATTGHVIFTPRPGVPPEGRHTRPGGISITYDIYIYIYDKGIREY